MGNIYIHAVSITPNPVEAGGSIKIVVDFYMLFPESDLYPSSSLYPGADIFTLYPESSLFPANDLYPTKGGMIE